ncbi:DUF4340 domain-containing protein [Desulforhabdus amnigena]|jgi:hypothetical protein|uniref:DUF4340 domain-containing protein n=1 Tax=Desulforhabdus amnigena TaxID=40218 RepID=A0A9W6FSI9_9BACT|nr:DUF4340 domain-containing protein [Desulforhabdus amnigena]GLI34084.1 hypothetical protein DAMNIGENAA_15170 [Desulforhabdus amnigena]
MRWRKSIIYLVVLLLVGGYFYYFEVVKKKEKEAGEKEARKIFHIQPADVHSLEIDAKGRPSVKLTKEGQWKILEPVQTDVDGLAVESLLETIAGLERERKVAEKPEDLKPYGLEEPFLKVRFKTGEHWSEIWLGDKNPSQDGYYARVDGQPDLFLVSEQNGGELNKSANDLRKKNLFAFKPEDVLKVRVTWNDGNSIYVERESDGRSWTDPDRKDLRIKPGKVQNMLDQISWLRAEDFLENERTRLESHGLEPPRVKVDLQLKEDKPVELLLSDVLEKNKEFVAAVSSQLAGVVEAPSSILEELPRDLHALEDRSLLGFRRDEVTRLQWQLGEVRGDVVSEEKDKWAFKEGDNRLKTLKEPWRVQGILWELADDEYLEKVEPVPPLPEKTYGKVSLWDKDTKRVTLSWQKIEKEHADSVLVWVERDGTLEAVKMKSPKISTLEKDLEQLAPKPEG